MSERFKGNFTQQEPLPEAAIRAAMSPGAVCALTGRSLREARKAPPHSAARFDHFS